MRYCKEKTNVENISNEDWNYLAGLVDGEGSLNINGWKNNSSPRLNITNTNFKLLESIKTMFGGHISKYNDGNVKHKLRGVIYWNGENAIKLIRKLYPFLRCKQRQALLLIEWYLLQEPRKRDEKTKRWFPRSEDQFKIRKIINSELKVLNKRGIT